MRAAAPQVDAWLGSFLRLLPVAAFSGLMLARTGTHQLRPGNQQYLGTRLIVGLLVSGAVSYVLGTVLFFRALADGGLAIGVNAAQAGVVWGGVLLGVVILRERPTRMQIAGCAVIAASLAIIALGQLGTPVGIWYEGLFLAIGAGVCYAMQNVFVRLAQRNHNSVYPVIACGVVGALVPLVVVMLSRTFVGLIAAAGPHVIAAVLVAGCATTVAVAGTANAVRYSSVATVNAIGSAQIVLSCLGSALIFGEPLPPLMLAGVAAAIGGILLVQAAETQPHPVLP